MVVFDLETTGLPKKNNGYTDIQAFPGIVSIAWAKIDSDTSCINEEDVRYLVVKPYGFRIENSRIHGITHEFAYNTGSDICEVLQEFYKDVKTCDTIVAHNIKFDVPVVSSAFFKMGFGDIANEVFNKPRFCTMLHGKKLMDVRKFPKLTELCKFLFDEDFFGTQHHAKYDVLTTIRCFIEMMKSF